MKSISMIYGTDEPKIKRLEKGKPILDVFWSWINSIKNTCLPKSRFGKGVDYAFNNMEAPKKLKLVW